MNNDKSRRVRVRAVVAYPVVSVALLVAGALVLNPLSASQVMALASPSPSATVVPSPNPTSAPTTTTTATTPAASSPSPTKILTSSPSFTPSPAPGPSPQGAAAPAGVPVDHHVLGWIGGPKGKASYFPVDSPMLNASQFQTIRVRFTVHNTGASAMTATPQLEYRPNGSAGYTVVPEKPLRGIPFQVDREWVPGPGGGTTQGPLGESIPVTKFLTGKGAGGLAMIGHHSMGSNPDRPITLPTDSYTEVEFTVRLTMDAKNRTGYQLRVTDGHTLLSGTQVAKIRLGAQPAVRLSPGQRNGLAVKSPKSARGTGAVK